MPDFRVPLSLPVSPDSLGDLSTVLLTFVNSSFEVHPTIEYFVPPSATDGHVISHEHGPGISHEHCPEWVLPVSSKPPNELESLAGPQGSAGPQEQ